MSVPHRQRAKVMTGPGAAVQTVERSVDQPGAGQALVKVTASSLNFHDNINLMGLLPGPWPRVPMSDGAGEVVAVGPGVDGLQVGQRVMGPFHPGCSMGRRSRKPSGSCPVTAATDGCSSTVSPTSPAWFVRPITSAMSKPRRFPVPA
jgi:NADPH:quinone reductase-like Zn-dependent oxidoreductase